MAGPVGGKAFRQPLVGWYPAGNVVPGMDMRGQHGLANTEQSNIQVAVGRSPSRAASGWKRSAACGHVTPVAEHN